MSGPLTPAPAASPQEATQAMMDLTVRRGLKISGVHHSVFSLNFACEASIAGQPVGEDHTFLSTDFSGELRAVTGEMPTLFVQVMLTWRLQDGSSYESHIKVTREIPESNKVPTFLWTKRSDPDNWILHSMGLAAIRVSYPELLGLVPPLSEATRSFEMLETDPDQVTVLWNWLRLHPEMLVVQ